MLTPLTFLLICRRGRRATLLATPDVALVFSLIDSVELTFSKVCRLSLMLKVANFRQQFFFYPGRLVFFRVYTFVGRSRYAYHLRASTLFSLSTWLYNYPNDRSFWPYSYFYAAYHYVMAINSIQFSCERIFEYSTCWTFWTLCLNLSDIYPNQRNQWFDNV